MQIPTRLQERLEREFGGRIRMRWSNQRGEWHVEQKVGRAQSPKFYISNEDDAAIRAKDGFALVMRVRPGDRMPCPACGSTLKVPMFEIREVSCDYCRYRGHDGRHLACYFDLESDRLVEHLIRIDPNRHWSNKLVERIDAANDALLAQREKDFRNTIEAVTKDNFKQIADIPMVGYTGREFKGN